MEEIVQITIQKQPFFFQQYRAAHDEFINLQKLQSYIIRRIELSQYQQQNPINTIPSYTNHDNKLKNTNQQNIQYTLYQATGGKRKFQLTQRQEKILYRYQYGDNNSNNINELENIIPYNKYHDKSLWIETHSVYHNEKNYKIQQKMSEEQWYTQISPSTTIKQRRFLFAVQYNALHNKIIPLNMLSVIGEINWDEYLESTTLDNNICEFAVPQPLIQEDIQQYQQTLEDIYLYTCDYNNTVDDVPPNALYMNNQIEDKLLENSSIAMTEGTHAKQALLEDYFALPLSDVQEEVSVFSQAV